MNDEGVGRGMFRFLCVFQGGFWKTKGTAKGPRVLFAICFMNSQGDAMPTALRLA
jgi:hypothetical protein